jgi:hypothetical protein
LEWVEKTVAPNGRGSSLPVAALKDFYALDSPGFIFSAPAVVIEEMFARSLFGLPPSMKVQRNFGKIHFLNLYETTRLILCLCHMT